MFVNARFGFGPTQVAHLFVLLGVFAVLTQTLLMRRLTRHLDDLPILTTGLLIMLAANLTTASAPSEGFLLLAIALIALGNSLIQAPLASVVSKLIGGTEQGLASGGSQCIVSLAAILGPIAAGAVYVHAGQSAPYWLNACLLAVAVGVLLLGRPQSWEKVGTPSSSGGLQ